MSRLEGSNGRRLADANVAMRPVGAPRCACVTAATSAHLWVQRASRQEARLTPTKPFGSAWSTARNFLQGAGGRFAPSSRLAPSTAHIARKPAALAFVGHAIIARNPKSWPNFDHMSRLGHRRARRIGRRVGPVVVMVVVAMFGVHVRGARRGGGQRNRETSRDPMFHRISPASPLSPMRALARSWERHGLPARRTVRHRIANRRADQVTIASIPHPRRWRPAGRLVDTCVLPGVRRIPSLPNANAALLRLAPVTRLAQDERGAAG
jgi:hypothetical protein